MTAATGTRVEVELPPKLIPLFLGPARVRASRGGRGSGKTRSFAKMAAVKAYQYAQAGRSGIVLCCREYMNSLDESSLAEVKAAILETPWLADRFDVGEKYVKTQNGRVEFRFAGLWRNLDSIKSKAKILLCWVDEADPVSEAAWIKLIPTIREEDSELWVTYNRERRKSETDKRFGNIKSEDPDIRCVELNWRDNPWFPEVLDKERLRDLRDRPEQYDHIWEGDYATVVDGAYFAKHLIEAKEHGRITNLAENPLMQIKAFWDLGGRGKKSDATVVIIAQWIGHEIRVLDYYEAVGQDIKAHINWMRRRGYESAYCYLPHDGAPVSPIADASWETALSAAGFEVEVVPNQGTGAAADRVSAARQHFPQVWFNERTTQALRDALGWYHEKKDDKRDIGLGPEHDWSSHAADAFGMMCIVWHPPATTDDMAHDYETEWVV